MEKLSPPTDLLKPCPVPQPNGLSTNADLQNWAVDLIEALRECDADKTALRQWNAKNEDK